jgi:chromosome segregation ATPase
VLLQDQSTQSNKSLDSLRGRHDRVKAEAKRIASENFVLIDQYRSIRSDLDNLEMRSDTRVRVLEQAAEAAEGLVEEGREECRRKDLLLVAGVGEIDGLEKRVVEVERENEELNNSIVQMKAVETDQSQELGVANVRTREMNEELQTANARISDLELHGVHQNTQLYTALSQITQFELREVEQAQDLTSVRCRVQELEAQEIASLKNISVAEEKINSIEARETEHLHQLDAANANVTDLNAKIDASNLKMGEAEIEHASRLTGVERVCVNCDLIERNVTIWLNTWK